jgi:hypothetical protein
MVIIAMAISATNSLAAAVIFRVSTRRPLASWTSPPPLRKIPRIRVAAVPSPILGP